MPANQILEEALDNPNKIAPTPADQQSAENPELNKQQAEAEQRKKQLFEFSLAKTRLKQLVDDWQKEINDSKQRRKVRNIDVSPKKLREQGVLKPDETLIPMRVINTNIEREKPPFISFLKQSRRLAIFRCLDNPKQNTEQLEKEFTEGMEYSGWEQPHFKNLDGAQTHGWDSVEVVFDDTKPLHVSLEHIGHDKLFFPKGAVNLQACELLIRCYTLSQIQLRSFIAEFGFDRTQVESLLSKFDSETRRDEVVTIYKCFFKCESIVYVAWFDLEACADWLKTPQKHYIGIRDKQKIQVMKPQPQPIIDPTTGASIGTQMVNAPTVEEQWVDADLHMYPVFLLPYSETEEQELFSHKGRVFFDCHQQEAQTAIASGFVNGLTRAANVYGSVESDPSGSTAAPKQLDTKLEHGAIYDKKIQFWNTNYPDPMCLNALQFFSVQNSNETGQLNFAVANRKDSRKTATEIQTAEQQTQLLSSVQVTLFSTFLRELYGFCWLIVQSQALQEKIQFLLTQIEVAIAGMSKTVWVNNIPVIGMRYDVRAAGDVDVVQRAEKLQRMMQFWPIIAATPVANKYLQMMLKVAFPEDGDELSQMIDEGNQVQQLIVGLLSIIKTAITPEMMMQLPPEQQQLLTTVAQMVQQKGRGGNDTSSMAV